MNCGGAMGTAGGAFGGKCSPIDPSGAMGVMGRSGREFDSAATRAEGALPAEAELERNCC